MVSQAQRVNLSEYKTIENKWQKAISKGKIVTVDITVNYSGGVRPSSFKVDYTIDGEAFCSFITN